MAKYRVLARSFHNHSLVEPGDVVEFDGIPSGNFEPLDKEAKEAAALTSKANAESEARRKIAAAGGEVKPPAAAAGNDLV